MTCSVSICVGITVTVSGHSIQNLHAGCQGPDTQDMVSAGDPGSCVEATHSGWLSKEED